MQSQQIQPSNRDPGTGGLHGRERQSRLGRTGLALGDNFFFWGGEFLYRWLVGSTHWLVSSPIYDRRKQARSLGPLPSVLRSSYPHLSQSIRDRRVGWEVTGKYRKHTVPTAHGPLVPVSLLFRGHLLPFHTPRIKMKQQQFLLRDLN